MTGIVPRTIVAGFNFEAAVSLTEYSGAEWRLVLNLRGPEAYDVEAGRNGACHLFAVTGADSGAWKPGHYAYTVRATNGSDVRLIEKGEVQVEPDIASAGAGFDGRSPNRRALDAIEAVIANRATLDQERYRINNRELYRTPIADLLKLRAHYLELVNREDAKRNGKGLFGRQVKFRMGPTA